MKTKYRFFELADKYIIAAQLDNMEVAIVNTKSKVLKNVKFRC